tara:strand:+ start:598 stop:1767 length:1170 start_codon:yes stop_codon:yes gene_type:complete
MNNNFLHKSSIFILFYFYCLFSLAQENPRARDIGISFSGISGAHNAITDVAGVTVGYKTITNDLENKKAVRTGVTIILPRGKDTLNHSVFGGWFSLNGNGEMTGTTWLEESGFLEGPIALTNTHSVGVVHDALIKWRVAQGAPDASGFWWSLPLVAETYDGYLNDINGFHVKTEHVFNAIESAKNGPIKEGNVGSGNGMSCHGFKCGMGTSSRILNINGEDFTVGVLVQANYGERKNLRIGGLPIGEMYPTENNPTPVNNSINGDGSIIIVVATDAPLLPHQLKRVARRATLGLGRVGSIARNGSGDIFIAFSTANTINSSEKVSQDILMLQNDHINPVFQATVEATEEAIINALIAGEDMRGHLGRFIEAIDHQKLKNILSQYNRLSK